ncbi:hypothetical protein [Dysgonomonas macrotermitis]|uniref:Uncharacterized protein n=1 Tax=Dysgonomonas macrotermitis TaxID=1346286 RepID=A0A1M5C5N6_9BACT|nr:hypothetical protein [Dysgonomonas macrotermitis]SHF50021.1 hypothetical protein SAMN05444362_10739 [Dysgonomonas macrotermitis]
MNLKAQFTMIKSLVGKKTASGEQLKKSYHIYDRCEICPLPVYIDVVCNDNLKALIIKGNVPEDVLSVTRTMLTVEFAELSGNTQMAATLNVIRQINLRKIQIECLRLSANLIAGGKFEDAIEYLKPYHIRIDENPDQNEIDRVVKQIEGKLKGRIVSLHELLKRYESLSSKTEGDKPKPEYYTEMLIAVSKYTGFHLQKEKLTVSEFAIYLKNYNQYIETLNKQSHGR